MENASIARRATLHSNWLRPQGKEAQFLFSYHHGWSACLDHCAGIPHRVHVPRRRRIGEKLSRVDGEGGQEKEVKGGLALAIPNGEVLTIDSGRPVECSGKFGQV